MQLQIYTDLMGYMLCIRPPPPSPVLPPKKGYFKKYVVEKDAQLSNNISSYFQDVYFHKYAY